MVFSSDFIKSPVDFITKVYVFRKEGFVFRKIVGSFIISVQKAKLTVFYKGMLQTVRARNNKSSDNVTLSQSNRCFSELFVMLLLCYRAVQPLAFIEIAFYDAHPKTIFRYLDIEDAFWA